MSSFSLEAARKERARSALARCVFIKRRLLEGPRPGEVMTMRRLAEEWECTVKTVQRDIEFLRSRLGHRIAYDPKSWRLYYETIPEPVL
jgi:hypothetical protein